MRLRKAAFTDATSLRRILIAMNIRRLKEENEFLEEASAFFAASRRKSAKNRD
ncbi:hypothetical protein RVY78_09935 [Veillonella sp. YH-vei2232]|uniref:Uncharacterized protein n=1 Tax=Veillonella absiana TaxID=3079305 RepID=A0ABU3ZB50_9FIRM|nr:MULTISPECIES: hypothetical protein [unclassified Veillonella]MDV5064257.1 hypothetical protein [Veillonella sp. YH-vei2232]MDV5089135.1 hypothetical protein [Veillonella sp. YH-vei2233]